MIRLAPVLAAVVLMTACGGSPDETGSKEPSDSIQALVDRLSAHPTGEWTRSLHPRLDLPPSATVEEVIDRMFQVVSLEGGRVTEFRVLELRGVAIGTQPAERYNAARVYTNVGEKIVLFRRQREDWWTRVYDVKPST